MTGALNKNQTQDQLIEELHRVIAEKDQLISENNQALIVKDQIIAENAQVIAEKDQVIAENAEVIAKKDRLILRLRMKGAAFMEEAFLRFPHLPEQIFEQLDDGSLLSSREVARSWSDFVDYKNYPWTRIQNMVADLKKIALMMEVYLIICHLQLLFNWHVERVR